MPAATFFDAALQAAFDALDEAAVKAGDHRSRLQAIDRAECDARRAVRAAILHAARREIPHELRGVLGSEVPAPYLPILSAALAGVSSYAASRREIIQNAFGQKTSNLAVNGGPLSRNGLHERTASMGIINTHPTIASTLAGIEAHRASLENVLAKVGEWDTHPTFTTEINVILDRLESASPEVRRSIVATFLVTLRDAKDTINVIGNGARLALHQAKAGAEMAALAHLGDAAQFALKQ